MPSIVADLDRWLERFAPASTAESWDNVGLLLGDPDAPLRKVMTCLTASSDVAEEAVASGVDAIVTHHPILFRPATRIRADDVATRAVWLLAKAGVAVLSRHTAFDNARGGINDGLARRLGLRDVEPLRRSSTATATWKVVVFVPIEDREAVLAAAFEAGAGRIGDYEECSFSTRGRGTFFGLEGTNPAVGESMRRVETREWKVEFVCTDAKLPAVLAAVRSAHRYEEPAIDVTALRSVPAIEGAGRVGNLAGSVALGALAERVKQTLGAPGVEFAGDPARVVSRLAVVCGAGDDFLPDADRSGADALLTGEARFHRAVEARERGVGLLLAGHYTTERPGIEDLAELLKADFLDVDVWASRSESEPLARI